MNDTAANTHDAAAACATCAACKLPIARRICFNPRGTAPEGCPTINATAVLAQANQHYNDPAIGEFARQASRQEAEGYANRHERPYVMQPAKTRIVEICEFARKMDYHRLGLAFCMGLMREAAVVSDILSTQGFEVVSVGCKAGRTPKETIGITDSEKVFQDKPEAMCNPIFQARLLNHHASHLNILLGLCVGHDALFFQHATAPTTVLAVKDRVTGHNPLAAVYCSDSYYRRLKRT